MQRIRQHFSNSVHTVTQHVFSITGHEPEGKLKVYFYKLKFSKPGVYETDVAAAIFQSNLDKVNLGFSQTVREMFKYNRSNILIIKILE